MAKKKALKIIVICLISLILFSLISYAIDIAISRNGGKPIFIYSRDAAGDGGTVAYKGLGYTIIKWKKFDVNNSDYLVGVESHYLFNLNSYRSGPTIELEHVD